jgi:regulator of replication initiation timing
MRGEKRELELSRLELEKKYSLVVNSHQWLLQELCQILGLVERFRHELAAGNSTLPPVEGADEQLHPPASSGNVVDTGLEQIERLISALVHLDHEVHYIEDVDVYGCYEADVDKLVSLSKRLQRSNQTLQYELRQSVHENIELHRRVEELEKIVDAACRLQEDNDELRSEYDQLVDGVRNFKEHVTGLMTTAKESIELEDVAIALEKTVDDNEQLKRAVDELLLKVDELEEYCKRLEVDASNEVSTKDDAILEGLTEKYRQLSVELKKLEEQKSSTDDDNRRLANDNRELLKRISDLESELMNHHRAATEMESALVETMEENKQLMVAKEELSEMLTRHQADENSSDAFEAAIKELKERNVELQRTIELLESKIISLELLVNKRDATDDAVKEIERLRVQNKRLEEELEQQQEAINRQSQMILNLDDQLRLRSEQQRGTDVKKINAADVRQDERKQALLLGSSQKTAGSKFEDIKTELEANKLALDTLKAAKTELEIRLELAQRETQRLTTTVAQLELTVAQKNAEVEQLQSTVADSDKRVRSETEYFQRKFENLQKEQLVQVQKLSDENEQLRSELNQLRELINDRQHMAAAAARDDTQRADIDEDIRKVHHQDAKEPQQVTNVTVSEMAKLFTERRQEVRRSKSGAGAETKRSLSASVREEDAVDASGGVGRSTRSKAVNYEKKLISDLSKAVEASQSLLLENRRLRMEIEQLNEVRRRSRTEDDVPTIDTRETDVENMQLKNYVEELENEVVALKKTVGEQGMYMNRNIDTEPGDGNSETGDLNYEDKTKMSREGPLGQSAVAYVARIDQPYPSPAFEQESRRRGAPPVQTYGAKDTVKKHVKDAAREVVALQRASNETVPQTPESEFSNKDEVPDVIQGRVFVGVERQEYLNMVDENHKLLDKVEKLSGDLKAAMNEIEQKQAAIQGLERYLTRCKENMERLEFGAKISPETSKQFESLAVKTKEILSPFFTEMGPPEGDSAVHRWRQLMKTFQIVDKQRRDLLETLAVLQENSAKSSATSKRDNELISDLSAAADKLRDRIKELEQELQREKTESERLKAYIKIEKSDVRDDETVVRRHEASTAVKQSPVNADVVTALSAENEAMRRLLESRAPQLAPDFEERLMAEIERLSSECQNLRRQLASKNQTKAFDEGVDHVTQQQVTESRPCQQLRTGGTVDDQRIVDELKLEVNRLTEENTRLRLHRDTRITTELDGKKSMSHAAVQTVEFYDERRKKRDDDNDSLAESELSEVSSTSDGKSSVIRRINGSQSAAATATDGSRSSSGHRPLSASLSAGVVTDADYDVHRDVDDQKMNVVELRRFCHQLQTENEALRQKMAAAWKVSVQHAVSRSVAVQTIGDDVIDGDRDGTRRLSQGDEETFGVTYYNASKVPRSAALPTVSGQNLDTGQLVFEIHRLTRILAVSA